MPLARCILALTAAAGAAASTAISEIDEIDEIERRGSADPAAGTLARGLQS